jgi:hypothetical protein
VLLTPILACGPVLSSRDWTIIWCILGFWLLSFVLCWVNLAFIILTKADNRFKRAHFGIFLFYFGLTVILLAFAFSETASTSNNIAAVIWILPLLIPLLVIGHFIYLLIYRRWLKRNRQKSAQNMAGTIRGNANPKSGDGM